MRRIAVATAMAAMAATLLITASAGAATGTITWGACTDEALVQADAQCGYLSVPLDYDHPNGRQIQLAVSRIQHTSNHYQGILLTNPGGPGGSGLNLNAFLKPVLKDEGFDAAADDYDWIGFDPRGVGSSVPALHCDPNYFSPDRPSYVPRTRALLRFWLSKSRGYADDCDSQSPAQSALLRHITTRDVALDMESIRRALGRRQINYYGFSYGTYLGQVYSTLFPSRVRRLVMDSNVDPRKVWYEANLDQDLAFDRNENIWFGWLAKYDSVYHLGATQAAVRRLFYRTEHQLRRDPAGGVVGPDEWVDIFLYAGYYEQTWLDLAQLFSDWVHNHDAAAAQALIDEYQADDSVGDDNGYAVYDAVQCTDVQWPTSWRVWSRDNWAVFAVAPLETWGNAWFNAPCIYWHAPAHQPVHVDGRGVSSALLIDETLDAATPFPGSLEVRRRFPNSVLVAEPGGTSHADSLFGDLCVDSTIGNYLGTGALPPRKRHALWDKTCAPLSQPVPEGAGAAAPQAASKAASRARSRELGRLRLAAKAG